MSILVVDDSLVERTNLKNIIEAQGESVLMASSGDEALSLAEQNKPQLILLDIIMGGTDGFNVCRKLRSNVNTKDIPVVMVSSKKNKADKIWAEEQGANDYVVKPYEESVIISILKKYL